jgi:hypothetical protein
MGRNSGSLGHATPKKTARHAEMEPQGGSIVENDLQVFPLATDIVNPAFLQTRGWPEFRVVNDQGPYLPAPDFSTHLAAQRFHFRQFGHDQTPCEFKGM